MSKLIFINHDGELPTFESSYKGYFVLINSDKLYVGTDGGWKELTNSELGDLTSLATGNKNSIVDAVNELKTLIDTSLVTYSLEMTEYGSVRCLKNGNEDGFELGADGSVQIA